MDPFGLEGRLTSEVRDIKGTCHLLCFDLARKEVKEERTDLIESQLFGFAVCVCPLPKNHEVAWWVMVSETEVASVSISIFCNCEV